MLVLPSRTETYGMVVTEALAHGLPVIATAVGGVPEALGRADDGNSPGLLVPPDDVAAFAAALRRWLDDPLRRRRLRRAAARRRLTLSSWSRTADRVSDRARGGGLVSAGTWRLLRLLDRPGDPGRARAAAGL